MTHGARSIFAGICWDILLLAAMLSERAMDHPKVLIHSQAFRERDEHCASPDIHVRRVRV